MWEGEWRCGKRDGPGVMNHADGRTIECEWHADVLQGQGDDPFEHYPIRTPSNTHPTRPANMSANAPYPIHTPSNTPDQHTL